MIAPPAISANSSGVIPGCSAGWLRYQAYQTTAHTRPAAPKAQKVARQPSTAMRGTTSTGVRAPPTRLAAQTKPCARARSVGGNHRPMLPDAFGYAPASPAPNRKRVVTSME